MKTSATMRFTVSMIAATWCAGLASAQKTTESVKVDLQPCIIAKAQLAKDTSGVTEAYLFNEFFKGFWASSQYIITAPASTDVLDLTVTGDDAHGRCNVVFVGKQMTSTQIAQLTAYSQKFQARIVYFDEARTAEDTTIMTKLGMEQYFAAPLLNIPVIKLTSAADPRVVNSALQTDPLTNAIFTRPVRQVSTVPANAGTVSIVADYADSKGKSLVAVENGLSYASAALVTFKGVAGEEEMHVFFALGWFDMGSWAWAHYIMEWGTKGIFSGERRFWLGATADDLFLGTNVFKYDGVKNEGTEQRLTGTYLADHLAKTAAINTAYNSQLVTEMAFNANGILSKVASSNELTFANSDAALLTKGTLPTVNTDGTIGLASIHNNTWWSTDTIAALRSEYTSGKWNTDDLLVKAVELKDSFYWQSHTMAHFARDNLGTYDCQLEDGANAQMAVITGLFASSNYDWRSMVTPGITGLFNKNCLMSATANLITCAAGDNTYDGVQTSVSLVSPVSQFHSTYTTSAAVGFSGFQIAPRFASYVYYNCVSTDCLILENLYIRRVVCGCASTDPGTITALNTGLEGCTKCTDLQALLTVNNIFDTEANTAARWIMTGRRDKYMFHQANLIPTTTPGGTMSLLDYWYAKVMAKMSSYINLKGTTPFPVKSVKFDDLCTNFKHHETLDGAAATVTMTVTSTGTISGMTLASTNAAGVIPLTVPTSKVATISTTGLPYGQPYKSETYGSDTTYYIATSASNQPAAVTAPSSSSLAPVPPSGRPGKGGGGGKGEGGGKGGGGGGKGGGGKGGGEAGGAKTRRSALTVD